MTDSRPADRPSIHRHKMQLAWQILVPFFLMLAGILALSVLAGFGAKSDTRIFADISIIWLLFPALFIALVGLAVMIGLIWLTAKGSRLIPHYSSRVQSFFEQVNAGAARITGITVKPVVWVHQAGAVIRSIFTRR